MRLCVIHQEKKIPLYLWTHEARKQIRCSEIQSRGAGIGKIVIDIVFQNGEKGRKESLFQSNLNLLAGQIY